MFKLFIIFISILFNTNNQTSVCKNDVDNKSDEIASFTNAEKLYTTMNLKNRISFDAFLYAFNGFSKIDNKSKEILTLIDFTKPSTEERLFVLDLKDEKVLYSSVVSHGRNSGENYATSFSNQLGSYKSSLGFYLTENTYQGKNGYSLILEGLEKNINDKAKDRAIVMHGAPYANPSVAKKGGRLGRSLGCPALPQNMTYPIIDAIKNGSVVFIYAENKEYLEKSSFIS